jgi:hypothetical protein
VEAVVLAEGIAIAVLIKRIAIPIEEIELGMLVVSSLLKARSSSSCSIGI